VSLARQAAGWLRLLVEFELVGRIHSPGGVPIAREFKHRPTLPPRNLDRMEPESPFQSGTQTSFKVPVRHGVPILPLIVQIGDSVGGR